MNLASLENFKTKVTFEFEADDFIVKTAASLGDLKLALKLRHQVFLEEGLDRHHETGLEFDSYDQLADHLLIISKETGEAVGTYRFIHSDFSEVFYSQGEFVLDTFLKQEGSKLEMGRACTHSEHRTGRTIDLLWQGLSRYIRETKTRYLFGCSSLHTVDPKVAFSVTKSLDKKGAISFEFEIEPTPKYRFENAQAHLEEAELDPKVSRALPPLLRSYLHAGSKVHGMPALDKDFECVDLLTILDLTKLNRKFAERYNPLG